MDGSCPSQFGHQVAISKDIEVPLEPTKIFKRLDLKTAIGLKGAYHVTSPSRLGSILRDGLIPGGLEGKRMMKLLRSVPSVGLEEQINPHAFTASR